LSVGIHSRASPGRPDYPVVTGCPIWVFVIRSTVHTRKSPGRPDFPLVTGCLIQAVASRGYTPGITYPNSGIVVANRGTKQDITWQTRLSTSNRMPNSGIVVVNRGKKLDITGRICYTVKNS
jgi:hypothetical protein